MRALTEYKVREITNYYMNNKVTVRETAKVFGISKSTVSKYLSYMIIKLDPLYAREVKKELDRRKYEGQLKGGSVTYMKWKGLLN